MYERVWCRVARVYIVPRTGVAQEYTFSLYCTVGDLYCTRGVYSCVLLLHLYLQNKNTHVKHEFATACPAPAPACPAPAPAAAAASAPATPTADALRSSSPESLSYLILVYSAHLTLNFMRLCTRRNSTSPGIASPFKTLAANRSSMSWKYFFSRLLRASCFTTKIIRVLAVVSGTLG